MCTICSLTIEFAVEHPQSLAVAVATRKAIEAGILAHANTGTEIDMARSRHDAVVLLTRMQQRLERVLPISRLMPLPDFYLLMVESRTWGYFHPTFSGFDVNASPSTPRLEADENGVRDSVIVMSQVAGAGIVEGRLPFDHALIEKVAIIDAQKPSDSVLRTAFITAYPAASFSEFVCSEIA